MGWNNIVIEGFCLTGEGEGKCPCGMEYPTTFCLSSGMCPHFSYTESTERSAAFFVPLRLIIWDKLLSALDTLRSRISWIFWDRLWFNRNKRDEFWRNMETVSSDTCPQLAEFEAAMDEADNKFTRWLADARKEDSCLEAYPAANQDADSLEHGT